MEQIVELYCLRFKIEAFFYQLKNTVNGFAEHFWSKAMAELNRFDKNAVSEGLRKLLAENGLRSIALVNDALMAAETFVQ